MLNNTKHNELLSDMKVIWRIEQGQDVGLHLYLVIYYDGNRRGDVSIARDIGEYWRNVVTQGRGDYWNSNATKEKFTHSAWGDFTGQINWDSTAKRIGLRAYLVSYFCKDSQYALMRDNPRARLMGMSHIPPLSWRRGWLNGKERLDHSPNVP